MTAILTTRPAAHNVTKTATTTATRNHRTRKSSPKTILEEMTTSDTTNDTTSDTTNDGGSAGNLTISQFDLTRHNGYITIHNPATGNHRTFHIETVTDKTDALAGKRIVRLLTGMDRDNPAHWKGFAFADDFGVHVWRRLRGSDKPSDYERYARMLSETKRYAGLGVRYLISGTCRRCNRTLTNPESIDSGIGPVCAEKSGH